MKTYFYSLLLGYIYILPIILAKILYKDDVRRVMINSANSAKTWLEEGRALMTLIHYVLNFGTNIFLLAPLTQILGVCILFYAGHLFIKKYVDMLPTGLKVISILSLIISPFFLENLSYGFESVGFCIALSFAIFSCCFSEDVFKSFGISLFFTVCVLSIYQSAIGGIIIATMLALYLKPEAIKLFFARIFGILVGLVVYLMTVAKMVTEKSVHANHFTYVFSFDVILDKLDKYLSYYKNLFFSDLNPGTETLFIIITVACLISMVYYIRDIGRKNIWVVFLPFISIIMSVLPMCFLGFVSYKPRVFLSFNIVCFFFVIMISQLCLKFNISKVVLILTMLWVFGFSYTFGNVLSAQNRYASYVMSCIAYDIGKLNNFYLMGNRLRCREAMLAEKKYKIFVDLNNSLYRDNGTYYTDFLSHYLNKVLKKDLPALGKDNYPILVNHSLYVIAGNQENIVIYIK